jgi:hypothetical protein
MWMGYYGAPQNAVFDTQTTLGSLKCKIDDLQTIVNTILPGSVPITGPNSTNNISLPLSSTNVTWSDPNTGNTPTLQHVLELIKDQISLLESKESGSGSGSGSGSNSGAVLELESNGTEIPATQVTCFDVHNVKTVLQAYLNEINYEIAKIKLILDAIPSGSESGSGSGSGSGSLLTLATINARDVIYTNPRLFDYTSDLEAEANMARNDRTERIEQYNNFVEQFANIRKQLKELSESSSGSGSGSESGSGSGSGLSIEQEEKLGIIGIPHSSDNRLFLDPAYSIQYLQSPLDYLDPVLNFTDRIRFQQRDPYLPIDIYRDNINGALVIKMNTPEIILPQQFQVRFNPLENTISFIKPNSPYDTTYEYYTATLAFGSDSRNVSTYNVKHDGSSLYGIINDR